MIIFYKVSSLCNHHTLPAKSQTVIRFPEHSLLSPFDQYRLSPKGINNYYSDFSHFHYSVCALWCLVSFTHWTLCLWDSFIFESLVVFCLFSLLHCILCVCVFYMIYSFILLLINILIASCFWLWWIMVLRTLLYKFFLRHIVCIMMGIYQRQNYWLIGTIRFSKDFSKCLDLIKINPPTHNVWEFQLLHKLN